jgi:protein-S-isoprenylcysteine O-methyltransferase Ste14
LTEQREPRNNILKRASAGGAILLSFIVALEIVIMISPFALFFYSVFNPFLLALNQSPVTRWLTAFFLPHMIVPPNDFLKTVRVLGSVFFIAGMAVFLMCASQVYLGKLLKKGAATGGLYRFIRHPQYLGLAFAALGLAIMWPRLMTLVLFAIMLFLYYLLARDEELRMSARFGESYQTYMGRTGMFIPGVLEQFFARKRDVTRPLSFGKGILILATLLVVIVGCGFLLRTYTVHRLPIEQVNGIDVVTITQEDLRPAKDLLPSVLADSTVASKLNHIARDRSHRILAFFIPVDYVMQGMIANTGDEWKLFEQHKTIGMITEYILHPFSHLTEGHAQHMSTMEHGPEMYNSPVMKRRIIFIEVSVDNDSLESAFDDFNINSERTPHFFVDAHLHTAEILRVQETHAGSGWDTVPTPMF